MRYEAPLIIIPLVILLVAFSIILFFDFSGPEDLNLVNDSTVYVGEGETCSSAYNKDLKCLTGLQCVILEDSLYNDGMCLPPGKTPEQYRIEQEVAYDPY